MKLIEFRWPKWWETLRSCILGLILGVIFGGVNEAFFHLNQPYFINKDPFAIVFLLKEEKKFDGGAKGIIVTLSSKYTHDYGTYVHELKHVEQCWRSYWLAGIIARFDNEYKLKMEIEAYTEQIKKTIPPEGWPTARHIAALALMEPEYGFNVPYDRLYYLLGTGL